MLQCCSKGPKHTIELTPHILGIVPPPAILPMVLLLRTPCRYPSKLDRLSIVSKGSKSTVSTVAQGSESGYASI